MKNFANRNSVRRGICFTFILILITDIVAPTAALALTTGPSQPEVQTFEPISTSDMVDLFSGDFKYNIPLLDVEGYPINIAYASGVSTDQEASWVGLGWNLNVGTINRAMRGVPDDFKGEQIVKQQSMRANMTYGVNSGVDFEIFGKESTKSPGLKKGKKFKFSAFTSVGIQYNTYNGFGIDYSSSSGIAAGVGLKGKLDAGLGLHSSGNSIRDIISNISFASRVDKSEDRDRALNHVNVASGAFGGLFNSRAGLKQLAFGSRMNKALDRINRDITSSSSRSRGSSGSINFGLQSYMPTPSMPMVNNSVSMSFKVGIHLFGIDCNVRIGGYHSSQKLAENTMLNPAFGYMYSEYGNDNRNALLDFNREKDGSFSRTTKNLPITNFTYDIYNVTSQGVGGAFRPFRSDVGHVFDPSSYSLSDSYSLGAEISFGTLLKTGLDVSTVDVNSKTGKWTDKNDALNFFQFNSASPGSAFEPYYFKQVGELSINPANTSLYNTLKGEEAFGVKVQQGSTNIASSANSNIPDMRAKMALERWNYDNGNVTLSPGGNLLSSRQKRNQVFTILTKSEAAKFGLQRNLYNSTGVSDIDNSVGSAIKIASQAADHHIGEVSVVGTDGSRYFYGLPVYNFKTKECSFNCSGLTYDNTTGMVSYSSTDASMSNSNGIDNVYNLSETPAYAYSYLLTAIVSADYSDLDNDGPDDDDIGTYTKFHYTRSAAGSNSTYKWRMPVCPTGGQANFNENSKANNIDNTANYTYGEKELMYLDQIETRNFVAKFYFSDRKDGFGVADELGNSGVNGPASKKLDRIELYAKREYLTSQAAWPNLPPVPIKTVHFEYDYSLATMSAQFGGKLPNNNGWQSLAPNESSNTGGKLTLKRVYFTYGKSNRAAFNQYSFSYASNPNYHYKAYDRWGNYKPFTTADYSYSNPALSNGEFTYAEQDKATADANAAAWSLSTIRLPSGGQITIDYESDDYGFVQNMPAAQMFKVIGTSATQPANGFGLPGSNLLFNGTTSHSYLIVDLGSTNISTDADFKKYYLKDINLNAKSLFFRFLVNLTNSTAAFPDQYEYVSGYAEIDMSGANVTAGLVRNGGGSPTGKAWIKIKEVTLLNDGTGQLTNPITLSAIQMGRINHGNTVWDVQFNPPSDPEQALKQLAQAAKGPLKSLINGFKNPNKNLSDKNYCQVFIPGKSMVRLYNASGFKMGGGSRVKKISLLDNWNTMTTVGGNPGQANSTYAQEYTYDMTDEDGRTVSSGIASYEPMIGGEENSMKQPYFFGTNKWALLAPDDRYYVEGPFGESFFPSPNVGYSRVKVKSVVPANTTTAYRAGYVVYEFYTAKDYPTITKHTPIMPKQFRNPLKSLTKTVSKDMVCASQGYVIMTNDMHGKAKAELYYAEGSSTPEKETRYYYKTRGGDYQQPSMKSLTTDCSYSGNQLSNSCKVIAKSGVVLTENIGIDFDAIADFRESETETNMVSTQSNLSIFKLAFIKIVNSSIWPSSQYELSQMRSTVLTKVINQYGILEKTVVREDRSTVTQENLAYDYDTGDVLVSKTTNDYDDPIYNVRYPAQWGYDRMGSAYKNVGINLTGTSNGGGNYAVTGAGNFLVPGDELGITYGSGSTMRAWVCNVSASTADLIDDLGQPVTHASIEMKIIRSGRRNLLKDEMSALTCLNNPLPAGSVGMLTINAASQVLDAKAVQFSDKWQVPAGFIDVNAITQCNCVNSTTGTDLMTLITNLLTQPCNSPNFTGSAFFNGVLNAPIPNVNAQPYGFMTTPANFTNLWKDPTYISTGTNDPFNILSPGTGYYGLTNNLISLFPSGGTFNGYKCSDQSSNPNLGTAACLSFAGPSLNGGPIGNSSGQIIGCVYTRCAGYCYLVLDFGWNPNASPINWSDPKVIGAWNTLANGNTPYINLNMYQPPCGDDAIYAEFSIPSTATTDPFGGIVKIWSTCLGNKLKNCTVTVPSSPPPPQCGKLIGDKINPYLEGARGSWRTKANYSYLTDRRQAISTPANGTNTDIRKDGYFLNYAGLYTPNGVSDWIMNPGTGTNKWVTTAEATRYNRFGEEVETRDALNKYSAAQFGYNESMPVAIASNAKLQDIAYDGFEDYNYYPPNLCDRQHHFDFFSKKSMITGWWSHTGKYSMAVPAGAKVSENRQVVPASCASPQTNNCSFAISCSDFNFPFRPESNPSTVRKYHVSYWVSQSYAGSVPAVDYAGNDVKITQGVNGTPFPRSNFRHGPMIDHWQQVEFTFDIPANYAGPLTVTLDNSSGGYVYFDDLRIHPYDAKLKSYVYDPNTLKYLAELDEQNYATLYEYDDEGNLTRIKKETERGVMTVKESKTHLYRP